MRATGRFGVNVLGADHAAGIHERARPGADRLAGLDVELTAATVPVVRDALAVLLCTFEREHAAGDHTLVLGRVHELRHGPCEPPLVFFDGEFRVLPRRRPSWLFGGGAGGLETGSAGEEQVERRVERVARGIEGLDHDGADIRRR
jgi:flavin reductase (DIM6/NTAB) family NADH-FMN oxidoreductase RutF